MCYNAGDESKSYYDDGFRIAECRRGLHPAIAGFFSCMNEFTNRPYELIEFLRVLYVVPPEWGRRQLTLWREEGLWEQAVEEIESGRLEPWFQNIARARYYHVLWKVEGKTLSPEQREFWDLNSDKLD